MACINLSRLAVGVSQAGLSGGGCSGTTLCLSIGPGLGVPVRVSVGGGSGGSDGGGGICGVRLPRWCVAGYTGLVSDQPGVYTPGSVCLFSYPTCAIETSLRGGGSRTSLRGSGW